MRDSDLLETAAWFLRAGAEEPFDSPEEREPVEVALDLYFPTGYTLDQLAGTLDVLETLLTAGFIAAEARALGAEPRDILAQLSKGTLAVGWVVESQEHGSLRIKAVVRRTGEWTSNHRTATLFVLGGVSVLAPHVGIPLFTAHAGAIAIAAWSAQGGIHGIAWLHDRSVQQRGQETASHAQVDADVRSVEAEAAVAEAPRGAQSSYAAIINIEGSNAQKAAFQEQVAALEGVEQVWYYGSVGECLRVVRGTDSPLDEAAIARIARETGVTFERIEG
jgi:hypothetical protein